LGANSELAPYVLPQLPADPRDWAYADFIAALQEVDNRSTWVKVRIIGAMADRYGGEDDGGEGKLRDAAKDTGLAHATVLNYRAVDEAYPVAEFGQPNCSVGVALAFIALDDRKALVSREEPWTREEARKLAAERAKNDPFPRDEEPARPKRGRPRQLAGKGSSAASPGSSSPVQEPVTATKPPPVVPGPEPQPCQRCAHLEQELADRSAALEKAHGRAEALELTVRSLTAELEARPSGGPVRAAEPDPAGDPLEETEGADSAHGEPCANCQAPGAGLAWASGPDGDRVSGWVCDLCLARFAAEHPERCYSREEHLTETTEADAGESVYVPAGAWDRLS